MVGLCNGFTWKILILFCGFPTSKQGNSFEGKSNRYDRNRKEPLELVKGWWKENSLSQILMTNKHKLKDKVTI